VLVSYAAFYGPAWLNFALVMSPYPVETCACLHSILSAQLPSLLQLLLPHSTNHNLANHSSVCALSLDLLHLIVYLMESWIYIYMGGPSA